MLQCPAVLQQICLVLNALRIARPPWDTIRWRDWEGTVLWACSPPQRGCTCHNWLHRTLTWIKSVIFHWWMTCWIHHFSCHPIYVVRTVCVSFLSLHCCLVLFFYMIYGGFTHPLPLLTPELNIMAWPAAVFEDQRWPLWKWYHSSFTSLYPQ